MRRAAFNPCSPVILRGRAPANAPLCAPRVAQRPRAPPVRAVATPPASVDEARAAPPCAATAAEVERLRAAYKQAKAVYKECKRARDGGDCAATGGEPDCGALKAEYRAAKAAYKAAKAALRAAREGTAEPVAARSTQGPLQTADAAQVLVCGGKACMRLGADAVALALGRGVAATAPCMKRCGGTGPTVCVGGVVGKVDMRGAVRDAVAAARVAATGAEEAAAADVAEPEPERGAAVEEAAVPVAV